MTASPELALANIGIAITRPVNQATKLSQYIRAAGGTSILFPLIEILPLSDYTDFDKTIKAINRIDWAIFIVAMLCRTACHV